MMKIKKLFFKYRKETNDYYLIEFNQKNLLTVGSQGFLTKKSLFLKTHWQPYLFHMDSNMDLVVQGYNQYIMMKDSIIHLHCNSIKNFVSKLRRNFKLFLLQKNIRRYTWRTNSLVLVSTTAIMVTFVVPFLDSLRGFAKKPDIAWFMHPIVCFLIPVIYIYYLSRDNIAKIFRSRK